MSSPQPPRPFRVVVLISGRGSNFVNLAEQKSNYEVVGVLSNRSDAKGLEKARELGIPARIILRADFDSKQAYQRHLASCAATFEPDLIALAGFMEIVKQPFLDAFPCKIINIHPSLLPDYPGLGTHQRVLDAGEEFHGCSVHLVDAGMDTGPLIAQAVCEVTAADSADELADRVLSLEHRLYPWVVSMIASGDIVITPTGIVFSREVEEIAQKFDFILP